MSTASDTPGSAGEALTSAVVHAWQCDHFGHLNVRHYAAIFDDAIFIFWSKCGISRGDLTIPVTAEIRISFRAEALVGAVLSVTGRIVRIGSKSVTLALELTDAQSRQLHATCDTVEVFFDKNQRMSASIPEAIRENLAAR